MTDYKQWLDLATNGASVNAVSGMIDMTVSTLDSQLKSSKGLKPDTVVKIARVYHRSPVAALVEVGLLEEHEARDHAGLAKVLEVPETLKLASDDQLLHEIGRRLESRKRKPIGFTEADS